MKRHLEEEWFDEDDEFGDSQHDADDILNCPSCGRGVHEDTQKCPHCGDWITPVDADSSWKRGVFIAAAIIVILSLLLVTVW